ncbi:MAG: AMP-binding protein [Arcicella sp.]|jgi:acyl-CoA synthetase (AMP-forming)/AMP-acid ligase II/acyl carrier protein|nr:AMP-binding protein [Arcicella sp.]
MIKSENTFVEVLQHHALLNPDKRAYTFLTDGTDEETHITYKELDFKAKLVGANLQKMGLAGERILLLYPYGLDYIVCFLGCLYAGSIAVPAYPIRKNQSLNRIEKIVSDSGAKLAMVHNKVVDKAQFETSNILRGIDLCSFSDFDDLSLVEQWVSPKANLDDVAFLQYTSGSTGIPKGVMITHLNILHNQEQIQQGFESDSDMVGVIWLPPYHDMGLIGGILQPIFTGAYCVFMTPEAFIQKPIRWFKAISKYRATTSAAPNFAYDLCVKNISIDQMEGIDLSSWKLASNGAETVRMETMQSFAEKFGSFGFKIENFYPCYGMAETTLLAAGGKAQTLPIVKYLNKDKVKVNQVSFVTQKEELSRGYVSCGDPFCQQEIVISNPHTHEKLSENCIGEIWVSGKSIAKGYWNMPELTESAFGATLSGFPDKKYFKTGDLGFLNEGHLYITGRMKDMMIIRGVNHYPQDIELTVEESHHTLRAGCGAVFSIEVEGDEKLIVLQEVERVYTNNINVEEVYQAIRQAVSLEHGIVPHAIVLLRVMSIPKTSSGKIQHSACKEAFLNKELNVIAQKIFASEAEINEAHAPKVNSILDALLHTNNENQYELMLKYCHNLIFETILLNPEKIPLNASFIEMGFDSLMGMQLSNRIERELGIPIEIREFLDGISVQELVNLLVSKKNNKFMLGQVQPLENEIDIENLSSEEIENLLESLLSEQAVY